MTDTHFRQADHLPGYSICSRDEVPVPTDRVHLHAQGHAAQDQQYAELRGLLAKIEGELAALQAHHIELVTRPAAAPPAPVLDDDEVGFGPVDAEALARWVNGAGERLVRVRLTGPEQDVQAALALLHSRHIHLDTPTRPTPRRDSRGVNLYGTLDIGEWLRFAAGQAAAPPASGAVKLVEAAQAEQADDEQVDDELVRALHEVYRERARLVAYLAALFPSAIAYNDQQAPEWPVVYIATPHGQLSWHLAEADLYLFEHVQRVDPDDTRVAWDGHSTGEKYTRLQQLVEVAALRKAAAGEELIGGEQ